MARPREAVRAHFQNPRLWSDVSTLGGLLSAVVAVLGQVGLAVAIGVAAIAAFLMRLAVARRADSTARRLVTAARSGASAGDLLYQAGSALQLSDTHPEWRMTLYRLDESTFEWRLRARASGHPELETDRKDVPLRSSQGILRGPLGRCDLANGVPDISGALPAQGPNGDNQAWLEAQAAWGIGNDRAARMRMHSRYYWGQSYRVRRRDGRRSVLGLVIETSSDRPFTPGALDSQLGRPFFEALDMVLSIHDELEMIESRIV